MKHFQIHGVNAWKPHLSSELVVIFFVYDGLRHTVALLQVFRWNIEYGIETQKRDPTSRFWYSWRSSEFLIEKVSVIHGGVSKEFIEYFFLGWRRSF